MSKERYLVFDSLDLAVQCLIEVDAVTGHPCARASERHAVSVDGAWSVGIIASDDGARFAVHVGEVVGRFKGRAPDDDTVAAQVDAEAAEDRPVDLCLSLSTNLEPAAEHLRRWLAATQHSAATHEVLMAAGFFGSPGEDQGG